MKTYKIIPANWTTYGHKYEIGKTYKVEGKLKPCKNGFHSCRDLINCYNFYTNLDGLFHVCIVEVSDNSPNDCIDIPNEKIISREITILKELSQEEIESILIKEINSKHDIKLQCLILETLVSCQKFSENFIEEFNDRFDCAHFGDGIDIKALRKYGFKREVDIIKKQELILGSLIELEEPFKTQEFCEEQCHSIVEQIKRL